MAPCLTTASLAIVRTDGIVKVSSRMFRSSPLAVEKVPFVSVTVDPVTR